MPSGIFTRVKLQDFLFNDIQLYSQNSPVLYLIPQILVGPNLSNQFAITVFSISSGSVFQVIQCFSAVSW